MPAWRGARPRREGCFKRKSVFTFPRLVLLTALVLSLRTDHAAAQEVVALTPMEANEVAKGYSADALKLKPVVNDKNEKLGSINDFIFGKDGNIYVVLAVGDFVGLSGHLIAIPFHSLKLDESADNIILPGVTRAALEKLPVYVNEPVARSSGAASQRR